MKNIDFIIYGNQEDRRANPIPYIRITRRSKWTDKAQRYFQWKSYVYGAFCEATQKLGNRRCERLNTKEEKIVMNLQIEWADNKHADPDNVFKGIADALFENDKNLDGSFVTKMAQDGRGKVIVHLLLDEASKTLEGWKK